MQGKHEVFINFYCTFGELGKTVIFGILPGQDKKFLFTCIFWYS